MVGSAGITQELDDVGIQYLPIGVSTKSVDMCISLVLSRFFFCLIFSFMVKIWQSKRKFIIFLIFAKFWPKHKYFAKKAKNNSKINQSNHLFTYIPIRHRETCSYSRLYDSMKPSCSQYLKGVNCKGIKHLQQILIFKPLIFQT